MPSSTELDLLLKTASPQLNDGLYVFCTVPNLEMFSLEELVGSFKEKEGITVIVSEKVAARLKLPYTFTSAWITLNVNSSLQAVGFTAAFSGALAQKGISCNVVAGFFHDHLFVESSRAPDAMKILSRLSP